MKTLQQLEKKALSYETNNWVQVIKTSGCEHI
jgi:hypothetical protein